MNTELNSLNVGDEVMVKNWDDSLERCKIVELNRQDNWLVVLYNDNVLMSSSYTWLVDSFVRQTKHTMPNN